MNSCLTSYIQAIDRTSDSTTACHFEIYSHQCNTVARFSSPASVLKRWKLNWCDLWIDGSLCFYKTDSRRELEHRVSLKTACVDVRSGLECGGKARRRFTFSGWSSVKKKWLERTSTARTQNITSVTNLYTCKTKTLTHCCITMSCWYSVILNDHPTLIAKYHKVGNSLSQKWASAKKTELLELESVAALPFGKLTSIWSKPTLKPTMCLVSCWRLRGRQCRQPPCGCH